MKWKHRCFHSKFGWKRNAQASSSISSDIQECRYTQRRRIGNPGSSLVVRYGLLKSIFQRSCYTYQSSTYRPFALTTRKSFQISMTFLFPKLLLLANFHATKCERDTSKPVVATATETAGSAAETALNAV